MGFCCIYHHHSLYTLISDSSPDYTEDNSPNVSQWCFISLDHVTTVEEDQSCARRLHYFHSGIRDKALGLGLGRWRPPRNHPGILRLETVREINGKISGWVCYNHEAFVNPFSISNDCSVHCVGYSSCNTYCNVLVAYTLYRFCGCHRICLVCVVNVK